MTLGSRSGAAITIAGSPGNKCCSEKIRIETKNSVGISCSRRLPRKFSMGVFSLAPPFAGSRRAKLALRGSGRGALPSANAEFATTLCHAPHPEAPLRAASDLSPQRAARGEEGALRAASAHAYRPLAPHFAGSRRAKLALRGSG